MNKGGARKGAGRPATGRTGVLTNFYLSRATVAELRRVPNGQRSKFVEAALCTALASLPGGNEEFMATGPGKRSDIANQ